MSDNDLVTRGFFQDYMDRFLEKLDGKFALREACMTRHESIDERLRSGENRFEEVNRRLKTIETRLLVGLGALMAFQFAVVNGWLTL